MLRCALSVLECASVCSECVPLCTLSVLSVRACLGFALFPGSVLPGPLAPAATPALLLGACGLWPAGELPRPLLSGGAPPSTRVCPVDALTFFDVSFCAFCHCPSWCPVTDGFQRAVPLAVVR